METTLEERLKTLETRLDTLQQMLEERLPATGSIPTKQKQGWQAVVGTFSNDPLYDEAMRLGREWRESQREDEPLPRAD